jgi:hypothetical protein
MPAKKWVWSEAEDDFLRRNYDPTIGGRSQAIANKLKRPRWVVNRRAAMLGLSRPKDRPWNNAEVEYLEANYHHVAIKALSRRLSRSETAVKLKAKRLGLRKYDEGYTAKSLAEALGVDPHWVLARIRSGKLRANQRRTDRKPEQGGDSWLITDDAVLDLLREYPYDIDLRKVDSLWFTDLIVPFLRRSEPRITEAEVA